MIFFAAIILNHGLQILWGMLNVILKKIIVFSVMIMGILYSNYSKSQLSDAQKNVNITIFCIYVESLLVILQTHDL